MPFSLPGLASGLPNSLENTIREALVVRGENGNVHMLNRRIEFVIIWYVGRERVRQAMFGKRFAYVIASGEYFLFNGVSL
jgi:hypothetical protein